jgi:hypothetical protein
MTNLHLGNDRREIADLPPGLSPVVWAEMLLPSRQKNIDNTSILLLARSLFFNRSDARSSGSPRV